MTVEELRNLVFDAIYHGEMDDAFGHMIDGLRHEGAVWEELRTLRGSYNLLKFRILQKSLNTADEKIELNQLAGALLDFLPKLTEKDIHRNHTYASRLIENPILIITHNDKQNRDIEAFAKMLKFKKIEVRNLMSYVLEDGVYDLIIFDNMDLEACATEAQWQKGNLSNPQLIQDRIDLMERYLNQTHYYFIHYGRPLFWCDQHHNRVQPADNRFELFQRIHEMIRFLDAFRV